VGQLEISALVGFVNLCETKQPGAKKKQLKKQTMLENKSRGEGYERVVAVVVMILLHLSAPHIHTDPLHRDTRSHTHTPAQLFVAQMNIPQAARDATKYAKFLCQSANENSQRYTKLQGYMYICAGVE